MGQIKCWTNPGNDLENSDFNVSFFSWLVSGLLCAFIRFFCFVVTCKSPYWNPKTTEAAIQSYAK